jgi:hypothetical protein
MSKKSTQRTTRLSLRRNETIDPVGAILRANGFQSLIQAQHEWIQRYSDDALKLLQESVARQEKIDPRRTDRVEQLMEAVLRAGLQGLRAYGEPLPDPVEWEKRLSAGLPLDDPDEPKKVDEADQVEIDALLNRFSDSPKDDKA